MASKAFLMTIMVAAAVAPAIATDYMVGDADGWKLNVNYTQWAAGKSFHVGDSLMFMYNTAQHNVIQVSGPDFKNCTNSGALGGPYKSGNDTIALDTPGRRWYICDTEGHCEGGMKLVVAVTVPGPAPAPAPSSQAPAIRSVVWVVASMAAAFLMIMA
ncbi:mavicyanin-like [Salvia miltiorrhiza]|uniref:mavicyanin-like n=1 Tax=Salvia miltiorrhiza TaxID=226208 RepID=UPI0025ACAE6B|nr:mavicyanin-like [Salvia miltiorrhiza]